MANIPTKGLSEIEDVVLSAGCQMHAVGLFKAVSAIFVCYRFAPLSLELIPLWIEKKSLRSQ